MEGKIAPIEKILEAIVEAKKNPNKTKTRVLAEKTIAALQSELVIDLTEEQIEKLNRMANSAKASVRVDGWGSIAGGGREHEILNLSALRAIKKAYDRFDEDNRVQFSINLYNFFAEDFRAYHEELLKALGLTEEQKRIEENFRPIRGDRYFKIHDDGFGQMLDYLLEEDAGGKGRPADDIPAARLKLIGMMQKLFVSDLKVRCTKYRNGTFIKCLESLFKDPFLRGFQCSREQIKKQYEELEKKGG